MVTGVSSLNLRNFLSEVPKHERLYRTYGLRFEQMKKDFGGRVMRVSGPVE